MTRLAAVLLAPALAKLDARAAKLREETAPWSEHASAKVIEKRKAAELEALAADMRAIIQTSVDEERRS